jgi:tRNA-Thr(GGU) m(6)t(6)A37 methyltransferase TsaA
MSALDWLRKVVAGNRVPFQRDPVTYRPVGIVRNRVTAPQAAGWENVRSDIILAEELEASLDELDGFSHVMVVFHFHAIPETEPRPLKHRIGPREVGVFASRNQLRPNTIGVGVARIVHRRKNVLRVRGLDAINGTPVLDLKPYLPPYDAVLDATLPSWAVDDS